MSGSTVVPPVSQTTPEGVHPRQAPYGRLSIGALSRATGIPVETLRTWEARYGFPVPERRPSGHRVYSPELIDRLRRVAEALARGHRARETVAASDAQLRALLDAAPARPSSAPVAGVEPELAAAVDAISRFDADALGQALLADWDHVGVVGFLDRRVAPLVRRVGEAWSEGTLQIRHEHFLSERLGDILRTLRQRVEEDARGPVVLFATPPGEAHGLGLQMAAFVVASGGCRVLYLGTDVPEAEIVAVATDVGARAVAVSVSAASPQDRTRECLTSLRATLPRRTELVAGGAGAGTGPEGVHVITDFTRLLEWARRLAA
jgi:DNA-binding transcriptional MerR regulator